MKMTSYMTKTDILQKMESDLEAMKKMAAGDFIFDTGLVWPREDQQARRIRYVQDSQACIEEAKTLEESILQGIGSSGRCLLMDDNFEF